LFDTNIYYGIIEVKKVNANTRPRTRYYSTIDIYPYDVDFVKANQLPNERLFTTLSRLLRYAKQHLNGYDYNPARGGAL